MKTKLSLVLPCCFEEKGTQSKTIEAKTLPNKVALVAKLYQNNQVRMRRVSEDNTNANENNTLLNRDGRKLSLNIHTENEIRKEFLVDRDLISDDHQSLRKNNVDSCRKFLEEASRVDYNYNTSCKLSQTGSKQRKDNMLNGSLFAENSDYQNLRMKRNRKAARMLGFLVAAFSICWLPFTIFYPLSQFYPNLLPDYAQIIIWWLGYSNSTINPFLYVYSNKNIR